MPRLLPHAGYLLINLIRKVTDCVPLVSRDDFEDRALTIIPYRYMLVPTPNHKTQESTVYNWR